MTYTFTRIRSYSVQKFEVTDGKDLVGYMTLVHASRRAKRGIMPRFEIYWEEPQTERRERTVKIQDNQGKKDIVIVNVRRTTTSDLKSRLERMHLDDSLVKTVMDNFEALKKVDSDGQLHLPYLEN